VRLPRRNTPARTARSASTPATIPPQTSLADPAASCAIPCFKAHITTHPSSSPPSSASSTTAAAPSRGGSSAGEPDAAPASAAGAAPDDAGPTTTTEAVTRAIAAADLTAAPPDAPSAATEEAAGARGSDVVALPDGLLPAPLAARLPALFAAHPALRATLRRVYAAATLSSPSHARDRRRPHRGGWKQRGGGGGGGRRSSDAEDAGAGGGAGAGKWRESAGLALLIELRMRDEGVAAFVELVCSVAGRDLVESGGEEGDG
jgi:hypothetical protein